MSVNIDWAEDHVDFQKLQSIVDNYALDGVDVDIEYQTYGFVIYVDGDLLGGAHHIDDTPWVIENHLEAKYQAYLSQGLVESASGDVEYLGSFAEFAAEES